MYLEFPSVTGEFGGRAAKTAPIQITYSPGGDLRRAIRDATGYQGHVGRLHLSLAELVSVIDEDRGYALHPLQVALGPDVELALKALADYVGVNGIELDSAP
jgi:hypothetical protein